MANPQIIKIRCGVIQGKQSHEVAEYNLQPNDPIYIQALSHAPTLAQQLNPMGPNGEERTPELRETMAFTGGIAELIVLDYLNDYFSNIDPTGDLIAESVPGVIRTVNSFNQIDIRVKRKSTGNSATLEVRSSNTFKKNTYEMYNEDQSLIGWYVTANKAQEIKKDYYVMLYFRHSAADLENLMQNRQPIRVHLAAGASKAILEQSGQDNSLRQGVATQYRIIKPIISAPTIEDMAYLISQQL